MYGYVVPVKEKMSQADFCLYRAFYCGVCKATGRIYGQLPRFTTNYDIVFLSVLLTDYLQQEVCFENKGCVCNPFKKKTTVCANELLDKLVATNIILSYAKADDDVIDDGAKKKLARAVLRRAYKKARATLPQADEIVRGEYARLRKAEQAGEKSIDKAADCFASMLMRLCGVLAGECDENLLRLCYNVGKFVYLADALDDIDEDAKKKRYNPFLAAYGNYKNRKQFLEDNKTELSFALASCVNRATECYNKLTFVGANDLIKNIVYVGLRGKVEEIFGSVKKLPKPKI